MTKSVTKVQDKDTNKRLSVVRSKDDPTKYGVVILNPDGSKIKGPKGDKGDAATISVGTTTTGEPGTSASVTNSGTSSDAVFNFTIPEGEKGDKGDKGDTGTAATIAVGTTTTGQPGSSASVTNSGTSSAAVFDFSIPKGDKGDTGSAATISVGTTSTGNPGTNASVTNSGTSSAAVFDFVIPQGVKGDTGTAATVSVGTTTTGNPGTNASVTNSGTTAAAVLNFTIPRGDKGETGTAATITAGTTTTGQAGTNASVTNSGTSSAAVFDFTIPKGDKGDTGSAATISVGTTTTGQPGTSASVTNSGTSGAAVFDFVIPEGEKGDKGDTGQTGATGNGIASVTSSKSGKVTTVTITETNGDSSSFSISDGEDGEGAGDVLGPSSSTDGHVVLFDGSTGKLIKDSGKALPSVINNLTSTSTTDALSAAQGKALNDKIADLQAMGKFLSLWDCTTGLPISFPQAIPYTYSTGDYYLVETVGATNYKPNGSSYTGTASTTVETDEVEVGDMYIYDGSVWLLQINHGKTVSFANLSGQPSDNTALDNALDAKADISSLATVAFSGKSSDLNNDAGFITSSSLPGKATSSTLGTVKLGSSTTQSVAANAVSGTSDRTYAIQTNSSDQMVVNVPWTDTTYTSKTAASGGTDVSLVTTGEKYTWNNKQNALSTQTAYTAKGSATKVPQITTNTLGQVTGITEVTITQPTASDFITDTAYSQANWDGVTKAPSADKLYDKISAMDTTISGKQAALSTQTAYTSKGSATKVPQITTNTLGQVTGITEVTITQPTKVSDLTNDSGFITSSSLPGTATSSTAGIVKLGSDTTQTTAANAVSTTASRTYSVQTNGSGQMVVNVPWENTTYESKSAASGGTAVSLVTTGEKYTWNNKLDSSSISDTAYASSWNADTTHAPTKNAVYDKISAMDTTISGKQATLVSGTNIKTINNESILGSGNLTITGGGNYYAGDGIEITEHSDMQGPAPDGFHVPLTTEWKAVYDIRTALGGGSSDGANFGIALKLPFAGYRAYSSAGVSGQGTYGRYRSSSRYTANNAYFLNLSSTAINAQDGSGRANGISVRCFKNAPTVPTSSWTKLYGTSIESGGIFWSSADGLISVSGDGTTWITIADKNVGATTVWNSGDTVSAANCGGYFQWGNNYMFPFTGSITTSSTQVDASNYGPGNYYSSNTFITHSGRWDSTDNGNLWGGSSQGTYKLVKNTAMAKDYQWKTKSGSSITLDLRNIITPTENFTVNLPSTLAEGEEYVLRCINTTSYTMTLGTGFTNPRNVDLTLSGNATDQFVFVAINGELELQPQFAIA